MALSSPPLQFQFVANPWGASPVPVSDLGSGAKLVGLILPLSLANNQGKVQIAVLARHADGCEALTTSSVIVTLKAPTATSLAEAYSISQSVPGGRAR